MVKNATRKRPMNGEAAKATQPVSTWLFQVREFNPIAAVQPAKTTKGRIEKSIPIPTSLKIVPTDMLFT